MPEKAKKINSERKLLEICSERLYSIPFLGF